MFVFEQVTIEVHRQQYVIQLHIIVQRDLQEIFIGDEYSLEAGIFWFVSLHQNYYNSKIFYILIFCGCFCFCNLVTLIQ
jgi:hypothetical protein